MNERNGLAILPAMLAAMLIMAAAVTGTSALAQTGDRDGVERPDDPYVHAPRRAPVGTPRSVAPTLGPMQPVQANIDFTGANINGDAANEPSLAVDPTAPNRIAIGWRQFDSIFSNFRQAGWAYSRDGGRTWVFPGVLENEVFRSDPVLDFDASGTFFYNSLHVNDSTEFSCQVFRSDDGGISWEAPVNAFGGDKAWMAVDRTNGIGAGHVYTAWSAAAACCGLATWNRSVDGGASFEFPINFVEAPRFGTMAVGPDGEQYTVGVQSVPLDLDRFLFVRSSNARDAMQTPTFDLTVDVDMGGRMVLGDGPNPSGLLGQADVGVDRSGGPRDGFIYMIASVARTGVFDPMDVMFVRSEDGGATWSTPTRVNDDVVFNGAWQWFGTMSVAPNGRIDVVWNDTRADPTVITSQLYHASSSDGGLTWSTNTALTVPFNHSVGYPQQQKLGDYYDMVSDDVGAHVAFAATFNGEQDVYYLRIGDYDCNGNGIADTDDLAAGAPDCNDNDIPDSCEVAAGTTLDADGNGIPDICEGACIGDLDGSGDVGFGDILQVIAAWGPCGGCLRDLNGNGIVDFADILVVISNWGPCA
ncbi:MAG: hypothetical protein GY715_16365 [Planctomycetes bacterium]|nr:hypothetical protein [Planctomycetota bacterium]